MVPEDMLLTGYGVGENHAHQHPYFQRRGNELIAGGTVLRQGDDHISNLSLSTQGPALIATVEGRYNSTLGSYDVKLVETNPESTVSSMPWRARPSKHEAHVLPGNMGRSYRWEVILGVGDQVGELERRASNSAMASVVNLMSESSAALLIEANPLTWKSDSS